MTLADQGCEIWIDGQRTHVPGVEADQVVDPTGCGDAFRGGLLYGLERGWGLQRSVDAGQPHGRDQDRPARAAEPRDRRRAARELVGG